MIFYVLMTLLTMSLSMDLRWLRLFLCNYCFLFVLNESLMISLITYRTDNARRKSL